MSEKAKEYEEEITQLANRIKDLRINADYTAYEFFAYENKISRSLYHKFEKGQDMRFSSIIKIAKAHNMSIKEFFSEGFE